MSASAASPAQVLAPEELGPEQRVDLELALGEATASSSGSAAISSPAGREIPSPVFGVRGVRFTGERRVGNGHLKGVLEDGDAPAVGDRLSVGRPGALAR